MNYMARKIAMSRMRGDRMRSGGDMRDRDREYDYEYDGKQGVRGTGRYGIGGSMYSGRADRARDDYDDYDYYPDYSHSDHEKIRLTKRDMTEWKRGLENADGTSGEHFMLEQIRNAANAMNLNFRNADYDEKDLCLTANMLYSDFCDTLRSVVSKDKEAMIYTRLARDFLEDEDACVRGKEKLAAYYYCIVCDE